ncbi:MAG: ATP synthase F1 subunit gamma [Ruminococcaceae bacterium]|nr:ATP synthase F1 subunit gamma [Oscillospiraceae bacterium]
MATVSTKEIKNRIRSMESTKQITRAMEMVASSKLRHAQTKVSEARPYFEILLQTIRDIVSTGNGDDSAYLIPRQVKRTAFVVIAGDRGLAGGYNSNLLKCAMEQMKGKDAIVLPIGKKAADFFRTRTIPVLTEEDNMAAEVSVGDCFSIAKQLCNAYLREEIDEIIVIYTDFVSVLSQVPKTLRLLPFEAEADAAGKAEIEYESGCDAVLQAIIPEYLGGVLYGALCESRAAEQAARRTAMNAATQNAEEMIADLSLKFNQARQAAITQEITEIVAGS